MSESASAVQTTPARFITRMAAEKITCDSLYMAAVRNLGTPAVNILAEPGELLHGRFWSESEPIKLPLTSRTLAEVIKHNGAPDIQLVIEYSVRTATNDPLAGFVMQTLDRMETLLRHASPYSDDGRKIITDVTAAMTVLKGIYSIEELLPTGVTLAEFREYFINDNKFAEEV
jgi:hypothetical protein